MAWLLLDVVLVLLVLVLVVVAGLGLYRAVRGLLRRVADAGEAVGRASDALAAAAPPPGSHPADASRRVP